MCKQTAFGGKTTSSDIVMLQNPEIFFTCWLNWNSLQAEAEYCYGFLNYLSYPNNACNVSKNILHGPLAEIPPEMQ